jgi:hypothetical protein
VVVIIQSHCGCHHSITLWLSSIDRIMVVIIRLHCGFHHSITLRFSSFDHIVFIIIRSHCLSSFGHIVVFIIRSVSDPIMPEICTMTIVSYIISYHKLCPTRATILNLIRYKLICFVLEFILTVKSIRSRLVIATFQKN